MSRWRANPRVTRALARAVVAAAVLMAALLPHRPPGGMLRLPPAVVVGDLRPPPLIVRARAPAEHRRERRVSPIRPMRERARAGERVPVQLTAYCLRGLTRRGNEVRPGIAAADPSYFPLSRYVEVFIGRRRVGRYLIDDTGGKVRGLTLDLWTESCDDARRFGRRRGTAMLVMGGDTAADAAK